MKTLMVCAAALAMAGPALAQGAQVRSSTSGLDLNRREDARVMLWRLDHAALRACGGSPASVSEMRRELRRGQCYREAMSGAVASLASPAVTGLYRGESQTLASR